MRAGAPGNWRKYYTGDATDLWLQRHFSYSDLGSAITGRPRAPRRCASRQACLTRLGDKDIPDPLRRPVLPGLDGVTRAATCPSPPSSRCFAFTRGPRRPDEGAENRCTAARIHSQMAASDQARGR